MATNIPPHNLITEVVKGCLALIEEPSLSIEQLMEYVQVRISLTAAIINGRKGIIDAYKTGRGRDHACTGGCKPKIMAVNALS